MLFVLFGFVLVVIFSMLNKYSSVEHVSTGAANYAAGIGVDMKDVDSVIARQFGVHAEGVIVNRVYPNTPAGMAGLKRGDIIVEINGSAIASVSMFKALLFTLDSSQPAQLTAVRENQEITLFLPPVSDGTGRGAYSFPGEPASVFYKDIIIASTIFIAVFCLLFFNLTDRIVIITLGAALMVILGGYSGFYSQEAAFGSIRLNVISLLLGLNLITLVLEKAGFFDYLANRILIFTGKDVSRVTIVLCIATYLFSAFVNNLTTIMVMLPISFNLIKNMPIDPKRFLFCEIAASNLGGASSMIGDFPNILISSEKEILFHDFFFNMTPVTILLLIIMLFYFKSTMKSDKAANVDIEKLIDNAKRNLNSAIKDYAAVSRGMAVLIILIIGFILSDVIHIHPSTMAITGGAVLLLFESGPSNIIKDAAFNDILFFCSLFVLVGGLEAAGMLNNIAYWLSMAAGENMFLKLVYIILFSALCASFLNAGPAAALFLPVVSSMTLPAGSNIVWWALSIGICIGSSATLTGATAGPISITLYEKYIGKDGKTISFMEYSKLGLPLMGIFTVVSILYIGVLNLL